MRINKQSKQKRVRGKSNHGILYASGILSSILLFWESGMNAFATDMILFSGTKSLATACTGGITGIATVVSIGFGIYNFLMLQSAGEQDEVKYKKKIKKAIICAVGIAIFGSVVTWVLGFYGGGAA